MITYDYQILRYRHDRATGEFINVGIVAFDPVQQSIKVYTVTKYGRITDFFPEVNGVEVRKAIRRLHQRLSTYDVGRLSVGDHLIQITNKVLPPDDSALYFTPMRRAIDISLEEASRDLAERHLYRYEKRDTTDRYDDKAVWLKRYVTYFREAGIAKRLYRSQVKTTTDTLDFDHTFQNGALHIYEPLSLDLKSVDAAKNKIYRWSGKVKGLHASDERIHLTFLSHLPDRHQDLLPMLKSYLDQDTDRIEIDIVTSDSEAERVARAAAEMIAEHDGE